MRTGLRPQLPDNVQVYSVGKEKGYSELRRLTEFYRHLIQILLKYRIDVCFSHMIPIFSVTAAPVLKICGIPIVTWYAHRCVSSTLMTAHRLSDRMVSVNASSYGYRKDKLTLLGHGIDTEFFSPGGTKSEGDGALLLSAGRLSPIKDVMTLIRAVRLLRSDGVKLRCALVGEAPERDRSYAEQLRREVEVLELGEAVQFYDAVPHVEMPPWYRRGFAHINLCPTGALDKASLEAMACGKPSLVANEGFVQTLGRWKDNLLFRHGDPDDLALKIKELLHMNASELQAMGTDLRRSVVKMHSLEGLANRLTAVLEETCLKKTIFLYPAPDPDFSLKRAAPAVRSIGTMKERARMTMDRLDRNNA
jgi:glycosyltransferase involved in cell wall biosynthesis